MNDEEKYLFDLRGYLVVKNALTPGQVRDLSDRLEAQRAVEEKPHYGSDRTGLADDGLAWSSDSLISWGGTYVDLIDLPTIRPYLTELLGAPYRLDHDYINVFGPERRGKLYLHGGGQGAGGATDLVGPSDGGQCFYRYNNGRFYNGLVAVAFELTDVPDGDGGFACVPGSHKVNFELPTQWKLSDTQADIPDCVDRVAANAGDAIIFTEACAHGTVPWEGSGERRTVFYKYCPHAVAWSPCYYNADQYADLSSLQRAMLTPPSAFGPHKSVRAIWERARTEQKELQALRDAGS
ncbi:MAG: mitomycin antibiotics/polyketide fumonisin biosynthesis protein [Gammaproteobacteria bacterium]|nr:mitomycin antibiotics/polyketide fumonisin biosynthesis protein [Gammaproteobacteria bacterium]MBS02234.1 mitomycin antibiotics/polyketide fumonisin biosynthesis protein [Gammaproteobacteria bacterium]